MTEAAAFLRARLRTQPRVFLVLGSGLGALTEHFENPQTIPFTEIPGFAPVTVEGHSGQIVSGRLEGVDCLAQQGRFHMYEGHSEQAVALPARTAADLGAEIMIVSNASGGINRRFRAGDLMLIDDHVNFTWRNPLIGAQLPEETRFPDMSAPYDRELLALARQVALQRGVRVVEGTYLGSLGPSYETPAEVRMYERLGVDAVGMSTVAEVIAARARGLRVLGISLISNQAAGYTAHPITHEEVVEAGRAASTSFATLVRGVLAALP